MLPLHAQSAEDSGLSANPGAVDIVAGTGRLGRLMGLSKTSGVQLGGVWLGDANYLIAGGADPDSATFNSLLILDLNVDLSKWLKIPGAQFGVDYLQFNGQNTNGQAGTVAGYNSLPGVKPLDRSELYELWWRQRFGDKLTLRVGKTVPTNDFNNVTKPLQLHDLSLSIPSVSGLSYTPVFVNPTLLGVMPGYYNSAYGITASYTPTKNAYLSYGLYDGTGARGDQTGLRAVPSFRGYYFNVGEAGYAWQLGSRRMPGTVAVGAWGQTGKLSGGGGKQEDGAQGFYAFASQRLWLRKPGVDNSGVTSFFQFGSNQSKTLIINKYVGGGFTAFGLVPKRSSDSFGIGAGVSRLNENNGFRKSETMLQAYYQMRVVGEIFFQPTMTYVPNPGNNPTLPAATAVTMRVTLLY